MRADVDCDQPGLERCHPRYTLGWRNREVQLHRDGLQLPSGAEYVHAYCDVWRHGRLEQVLASPSEKSSVREKQQRALDKVGGRAGPNVLMVVVRGLTLAQSRAQLPRTVRAMARLRRGGGFRGGAFTRFAAASFSLC